MANKEIRIKQVVGDGHLTLPATGAYGGLSPDGQYVICSFFVERPTIGDSVQIVVSDQGQVIAQHEDKNTEFTRELLGSYTMTRQTAETIGQWLITLAKTGMPNG